MAGDRVSEGPDEATSTLSSIDFIHQERRGGETGPGERRLAVVVCNWSLPSLTPRVLRHASFVIAADGGANRMYDELPRLCPDMDPDVVRRAHAPHRIAGDLDSIREDVRSFYSSLGVPVTDLSHDQDSTDLMKCLDVVVSESQGASAFSDIVALGTQGGRLDHILGNLSILHAYRQLPLILMGDGNLTRLVPRGKSIIHTSNFEGPKCGLIPLCGKAVASSRGLRWNLDKTDMCMGGLISSCNELVDRKVVVQTDVDLVWTTELQDTEATR